MRRVRKKNEPGMKIGSPLPHRKARIEIIPLIDIMFFLLASFMMASLSMMRLQSIRMNLPTATAAAKNAKSELVTIAVDKLGNMSIDKKPYNFPEMRELLSSMLKTNANVPVYITADDDATHGMVISVLDLVKSTGVPNASFAIASKSGGTK
jgi:biopolymer transport protein ExbD